MKNKVSYIIVITIGAALWTSLFIFMENKISTIIGLLTTILGILIGTILGNKHNFHKNIDNKTQKYFVWYLIIGCIITISCLIVLAYYVQQKA